MPKQEILIKQSNPLRPEDLNDSHIIGVNFLYNRIKRGYILKIGPSDYRVFYPNINANYHKKIRIKSIAELFKDGDIDQAYTFDTFAELFTWMTEGQEHRLRTQVHAAPHQQTITNKPSPITNRN